MSSQSPVIVALDFITMQAVEQLVEQLEPDHCRLKVGKELFTRLGPQVVSYLTGRGFDVFLDLKFHDIPNTVAGAVHAAADLGVWMVNVHASGGRKMMTSAADKLHSLNTDTLLTAVTVLTSSSQQDLADIGVSASTDAQVSLLAELAQSCGVHGVVCSARESARLKQERGKDFLLVTPGIRPAGSDLNDQQRVVTPVDAMANGSDYLVIGRPITASENPAQALEEINASLTKAG